MTNITFTMIEELIKHHDKIIFFWYDYIIFVSMLVLSVCIGIYFGCFGTKQSTVKEYLTGGKKMKVLPVGISLIASHASGITLLGVPSDVYRYGAAYWLAVFSMLIIAAVTITVFLPVFFKLEVNSPYEYLEKRFDGRTRLLASCLFITYTFIQMPLILYLPAVAFETATNVSVHVIVPIVFCVCIFYTAIGGLKAVVWTDTFQFVITVGTLATVCTLGVNSVGGFTRVWSKAITNKRLDIFDLDTDPTKRDSFWIILFGYTIYTMSRVTVDQTYVQKFLAVPTFRESAWSVIYYTLGICVVKTACVLIGLILHAKYAECDPFKTKEITRKDQLLPYYVMDIARDIPGLSGIFIAGIFSASLSQVSASLNCMTGIIYDDILTKILKKNLSRQAANKILRITVVVLGLLSISMIFIIERLGEVFPLAVSMVGLLTGPILAIFFLGILFPKANATGVFYGALGGFILIVCIVLPAKYYQFQGLFNYASKPLSTDKCDFVFDETIINASTIFLSSNSTHTEKFSKTFEPNVIFRITHYYYTLMGTIFGIILGLIISYMTNKKDPPVERNLVSPVVRFLLLNDIKTFREVKYSGVANSD